MSELHDDRIRKTQAAMRDVRRLQSTMLALAQNIETSLRALSPDLDWEDRYLLEGVVEMERLANGASPNTDE